MTRQQIKDRMARVRELPCIACQIRGVVQPNKTEAHHCNAGGNAGQKRRGDEFVLPLCQHHHRSVQKLGWTSIEMAEVYGPSLAKSSKRFRASFGTDDELLVMVNKMLDTTRAA